MKIYLWSLLLSLSLGAIEIPLDGSVYAYNTNHFYIDISSLEVGDTINIQISYSYYYYYFDYCILKYRSSDYHDDDEFLKKFETLDNDNYRYDSDSYKSYYDFYYSLTKNSSMYSYILLKMSLDYDTYVTIYVNKPKDNSWVIWLIIIIIIIVIGIIILVICLKRKKTAKALADSSHQPGVNYNQPPVNAYQPPVYEPQPPQYVQPS